MQFKIDIQLFAYLSAVSSLGKPGYGWNRFEVLKRFVGKAVNLLKSFFNKTLNDSLLYQRMAGVSYD